MENLEQKILKRHQLAQQIKDLEDERQKLDNEIKLEAPIDGSWRGAGKHKFKYNQVTLYEYDTHKVFEYLRSNCHFTLAQILTAMTVSATRLGTALAGKYGKSPMVNSVIDELKKEAVQKTNYRLFFGEVD